MKTTIQGSGFGFGFTWSFSCSVSLLGDAAYGTHNWGVLRNGK